MVFLHFFSNSEEFIINSHFFLQLQIIHFFFIRVDVFNQIACKLFTVFFMSILNIPV